MRQPIIAGNWKMHKLLPEATETARELRSLVGHVSHCLVIVAPPFTALRAVADRLDGSAIKVAAQNVCDIGGFGARTGEVSAAMLRDAGCEYVIIGHSERRLFYGETDEMVNRKIRAALEGRLKAIVCVGETLPEREAGREFAVVEQQIAGGLAGLTDEDMSNMIIAYEPVWAIGTGKTATPQQAQVMHEFIRRLIARIFGKVTADAVRILYGGSVRPDNIGELMSQPDVDGALVGGASLEARTFAEIVNYAR
ncbi:MAG TPA: triose-phosphate isomerase [Blastocatellia bacterium]|nr:triose-phosphate isomerase [Blastocatellia bacterium]